MNTTTEPIEKPVAAERESVRSSDWLGGTPPTTHHRDEGWWWAQDMSERNGPLPTRVTRYKDELQVQMFGWEYAIPLTRCTDLQWWGRAVPGVPPSAESSDLRTVSARESEQRTPPVRCDDGLGESKRRSAISGAGGEREETP